MKAVEVKDIAVIVLSCDKYSDLWNPFAQTFNLFWPNCPFTKYLCSNEKKSELTGFTAIMSGPDIDWSSSLLKSLQQIKERYIIVFFDDVFLSGPVTKEAQEKLISILKKFQPEYFRFRPYPQPTQWLDPNVGLFKIDEAYRTALFAVWDREILTQILRPGESAWHFEMESVPRSSQYKNFLGTNYTFFPYVHGVEKGKWFRSAVRFLNKHNIPVDLAYRPKMSWTESMQSRFRQWRAVIFMLVPQPMQSALLESSRFVRKNIWSKW